MPKTYLGTNALDDPDLAASQVTSGTFDDARIPVAITRDTELDTVEADLATAIADGDASTLTSAQAYAVPKSTLDANTVLYATADDTPAALAMGASTILARLAAGNIVAATPAQLRTLLALVVGTDVQAWDADLDALATAFARATASGPASLAFLEDTDNGSNKATIIAPASLAADRTLTLPDATGTLITGTQADAAYEPLLGRVAASVAAAENTTSTSYTDLTTAGPSVAVTVPASGKIVIDLGAYLIVPSGASNYAVMSFALSGANTLAASDANAIFIKSDAAESNEARFGVRVDLSGLTPGSTTVTAKYKSIGGGSSQFSNRVIAAQGVK